MADLLSSTCAEIVRESRTQILQDYPSLERVLPRLADPESWSRSGVRDLTPEESERWPRAHRVFVVESSQLDQNVEIDLYATGLNVYGSRLTVNGV